MINIGIITGRFAPAHLGHIMLFKQAMRENDITYIVIIQGKKVDLVRNPLSYELRKEIIEKSLPEIKVMTWPTANLPEIMFAILTEKENKILTNDVYFKLYCGDDRKKAYELQMVQKYFDQIKVDLDRPNLNLTGDVVSFGRNKDDDDYIKSLSATKIRDLIRNNKDEKAKKALGFNFNDEDLYNRIKNDIQNADKSVVRKENLLKRLSNFLSE